jgi:hypothetical protein
MNNPEPEPPDARVEERPDATAADKPRWQEPKLAFVEPVLTKDGDVSELTGEGFFGTFVP